MKNSEDFYREYYPKVEKLSGMDCEIIQVMDAYANKMRKAFGICNRILKIQDAKLIDKYSCEELIWIYTTPDKNLANMVIDCIESLSNHNLNSIQS